MRAREGVCKGVQGRARECTGEQGGARCVCEGVGRWYARGLHQVEREGVGLGHDQPRLDVVEQLADVELGGAVEELVAAVEEVDLERAVGRVGLLDLLVVALAGPLERPRANIRVVARVDDLRGEQASGM